MKNLRYCLLALMALPLVPGCVDEGQPQPPLEDPSLVPNDWVGYEIGLSAPTITEVTMPRVVPLEEAFAEPVAADAISGEQYRALREEVRTAKAPSAEDSSWTMYRLDTNRAYRVEFKPEQLKRLYETMVARGETSGFLPESTDVDLEAQEQSSEYTRRASLDLPPGTAAGWSNGVDDRTRRGIADGWAWNSWPYRAIGHFTNGEGCTGTLIGRRTVLTAAHCVAAQGVGPFANNPFRARSDNTTWPPNLFPYNTANIVNTWVPSSYTNPATCANTGAASQIACNRFDIAVVELSEDVGSRTGGFGYGYASDATLSSWRYYLRGYPSCRAGWADRPSTCPAGLPPTRNAALWGDESCQIGSFWSPGPTGFNREMSASCDGSRGMSGSALYTYNSPLNLGSPVAYGVYSQMLCVGAGCAGDVFASDITRITDNYASMIAARKSIWGG